MTRLRLNREFLLRHLFALLVMFGLGGWFAYDGFVTYPRTEAAELYESIERMPPPFEMPQEGQEAFKRQKIQSQRGLAAVCTLAGLLIGLHLLAVSGFRLEFDDDGFVYRGRRHEFAAVSSVDDSKWRSRGRARICLVDGTAFVLDAWHFSSAETFFARLPTASIG